MHSIVLVSLMFTLNDARRLLAEDHYSRRIVLESVCSEKARVNMHHTFLIPQSWSDFATPEKNFAMMLLAVLT